MPDPAVSIVMPCHNRVDALHQTLESLCRQTFPPEQFEVVVVDQASTDGSRELVRTMAPPFRLRLLEQDAKYGISVARNAGIEASRSSLVLLLDADLITDPELVGAHLELHKEKLGVLACGRVLPFPSIYKTFVEKSANPDAGLDRCDRLTKLQPHQAFGGHLSFLKTVFQNVGIFNPSLKGFEDIEFAYRAQKLKYPIWNCPKAISYHNHPRTLDERYSQTRDYHRMLPEVMGLFPEILGNVPDYVIYEPVMLRSNSFILVYMKLRTRFFASKPIRSMARKVLNIMDQTHASKPLARGCYWQLLLAYGYLGFQEGRSK